MKGMILAAGLGTRLRPITEKLPKPLLPVCNQWLIRYGLQALQAVDVSEIIVNLHHLGEKIAEALGDGSRFGVRLSYSRESEILGTGGGIKAVEDFLGGGTFLVVNSDAVLDLDLKAALAFHRKKDSIATMIVLPDEDTLKYGAVAFGPDGRILDIAGRIRNSLPPRAQTGVFSGVHIFEPRIFHYMPDESFFGINTEVYPRIVAEGRAFAFAAEGFWREAGDPAAYLKTNLDVLVAAGDRFGKAIQGYRKVKEGIYIGADSQIPSDAVIEPPAMIGPGCRIGNRCAIGPGLVTGANVQIGEECNLARCVVFEGVEIEDGTDAQNFIASPYGILSAD